MVKDFDFILLLWKLFWEHEEIMDTVRCCDIRCDENSLFHVN